MNDLCNDDALDEAQARRLNAKSMIRTIHAHKGPIQVPVLTKDDVWHVVCHKADLVAQIERAGHSPFVVLSTDSVVYNGRAVRMLTLDVAS